MLKKRAMPKMVYWTRLYPGVISIACSRLFWLLSASLLESTQLIINHERAETISPSYIKHTTVFSRKLRTLTIKQLKSCIVQQSLFTSLKRETLAEKLWVSVTILGNLRRTSKRLSLEQKWGQELLNGVLRIGAIIPHNTEQFSKQLL